MEGRRIDEVRIELPAGLVSIPRSSHEALLEQLQSRDSIADVPDVRDVLARAAEGHHLLGQRGGRQLRHLPEGIHELGNALHVDLPVDDDDVPSD